jgi:hypothetical protein
MKSINITICQPENPFRFWLDAIPERLIGWNGVRWGAGRNSKKRKKALGRCLSAAAAAAASMRRPRE